MGLFRLCSHTLKSSSVLRFQSGSALLSRSTISPCFNMSVGFVRKSHSPLSHFVGTRHYSVPRIQDYIFWPMKKCLSCVTFFTGRFETVPFTNQRLYYSPFLEKLWEVITTFEILEKLNKNAMLYPQSHPLGVRVESIAIRILEALQRESGRRHKLADREWILKFDGTLKVVMKRRQENVESTTARLKDGIDWEFFVADSPALVACASVGKILVCRGLFDVYKTENELAFIIATQVAHIVARHVPREINWGPCILYHLLINGNNPEEQYKLRHEQEADYIGMLLSASACYDPRVAPVALRKMDREDPLFHLLEERVKYISQPEVMEKAVKIYEERRD